MTWEREGKYNNCCTITIHFRHKLCSHSESPEPCDNGGFCGASGARGVKTGVVARAGRRMMRKASRGGAPGRYPGAGVGPTAPRGVDPLQPVWKETSSKGPAGCSARSRAGHSFDQRRSSGNDWKGKELSATPVAATFRAAAPSTACRRHRHRS